MLIGLFILLLLKKSSTSWVGRTFLGTQELSSLRRTAIKFVFHLFLEIIRDALFHSLSVSVDWHRLLFNLLAILDSLGLVFELLVSSRRGRTAVSLSSIGAESASHRAVDFVWTRWRTNLRVSSSVDFVPINNGLAILCLNIGLLI